MNNIPSFLGIENSLTGFKRYFLHEESRAFDDFFRFPEKLPSPIIKKKKTFT